MYNEALVTEAAELNSFLVNPSLMNCEDDFALIESNPFSESDDEATDLIAEIIVHTEAALILTTSRMAILAQKPTAHETFINMERLHSDVERLLRAQRVWLTIYDKVSGASEFS